MGEGAGAAPGPAALEAPGKAELVARGFALAGLGPGARVVDVGCGLGSSVALLRAALGLGAVGLDLAVRPARGPEIPRLRAEAGCLPFADGTLEGVLLECVLSIVAGREGVLRECARVLAPAGKLVLTDLYARGPGSAGAAAGDPCGAELLPRERLLGLVESSGFAVLRWEDHSRVLKEYLFRLIMEGEPAVGAWRRPGPERLRPGYGLLVAQVAPPATRRPA